MPSTHRIFKNKLVFVDRSIIEHANVILVRLQRPNIISNVLQYFGKWLDYLEREVQSQVVEAGIEPRISLLMELAAALLHGIISSSFVDIPRKIRTSMQVALHMQYRFTPLTSIRVRKDRVARSSEFFHAVELLRLVFDRAQRGGRAV